MNFSTSIFKDYDVRGDYPKEINPQIFKAIAQELTLFFKPKIVSVGRDNRNSSKDLSSSVIDGFLAQGVNVVDLGLITTDMIYFAAGKFGYDLNMMITGSHAEGKNGFKICKKGAFPISGEGGLYQIRDNLLKRESFPKSKIIGKLTKKDILNDWIKHALTFINLKKIGAFKIVVDTGNGMAGLVMSKIEERLPGEFFNLFFELDGSFPNHFPNPLIEENLIAIRKKILESKANLGIAFDADGDRAFFLDEKGKTISGTILTAMISKAILSKKKRETLLYNAVCGKIVSETIEKYGGKGIRVRVGHSIIKEKMRKYNAIFAGEHSGHFFFRDNFFSDSGLIATLKVLELFSLEKKPFSKIIKEFDKYFVSGEINFKVDNKQEIMKALESEFKNSAESIDWLDGISVWFQDWWFNVRPSNTEPLLRLNLEAENRDTFDQSLRLIFGKIEKLGGKRVSH